MKKTDLKKQALTKKALKQQVSDAIHACQEKKAEQITVLELEQGSGAFTDYFVVCSGTNPRQIQAISDEVELRLKRAAGRASCQAAEKSRGQESRPKACLIRQRIR